MTPVAIAGSCTFSEQHERTRVFALCEMKDDPVLKPVSVVGDPTIRGMRIAESQRLLTLQVSRLPATMVRAFIGLSATRGHDLTEGNDTERGPFNLLLKLNVTTHTLAMRPGPPVGARYGLLAIITRRGMSWAVTGLAPREYYPDRRVLNAVHQVPTWWRQRA